MRLQSVGSSIPVFRNLVYELTAGQVGTGFAWKLYICCAAATPVSGTRVASGLHPGTPKGVKVFLCKQWDCTELPVYRMWIYSNTTPTLGTIDVCATQVEKISVEPTRQGWLQCKSTRSSCVSLQSIQPNSNRCIADLRCWSMCWF